jgi:hypothetical protein
MFIRLSYKRGVEQIPCSMRIQVKRVDGKWLVALTRQIVSCVSDIELFKLTYADTKLIIVKTCRQGASL